MRLKANPPVETCTKRLNIRKWCKSSAVLYTYDKKKGYTVGYCTAMMIKYSVGG